MEAMLRDSLAQNAALQAQMLQTNALLGETIAQQGKTFTAYFTAATIAEKPEIRDVDDFTLAGLERRRIEERVKEGEIETLGALGITPNGVQTEMDSFFAEFKRDFGGMS